MASLNKVFLIGNLTRNPELRYTPSGAAVCEFGMAINRTYTSNNEKKEEVCFLEVVVWGKQAEACDKYLQKGAPLLVEGRIQMDQWTDKETQKQRSKLKIVAERTQFIGAPRNGGDFQQHDDGNYAGNSGAYGGQPQHQQPPVAPTTPPNNSYNSYGATTVANNADFVAQQSSPQPPIATQQTPSFAPPPSMPASAPPTMPSAPPPPATQQQSTNNAFNPSVAGSEDDIPF